MMRKTIGIRLVVLAMCVSLGILVWNQWKDRREEELFRDHRSYTLTKEERMQFLDIVGRCAARFSAEERAFAVFERAGPNTFVVQIPPLYHEFGKQLVGELSEELALLPSVRNGEVSMSQLLTRAAAMMGQFSSPRFGLEGRRITLEFRDTTEDGVIADDDYVSFEVHDSGGYIGGSIVPRYSLNERFLYDYIAMALKGLGAAG